MAHAHAVRAHIDKIPSFDSILRLFDDSFIRPRPLYYDEQVVIIVRQDHTHTCITCFPHNSIEAGAAATVQHTHGAAAP